MRISCNWIRELVDTRGLGGNEELPRNLADLLTQRGIEVESIESQSKGFDRVVTARILRKDRHPQADRLSLCQVDGGAGSVEIVCGATNMKAGDIVALALPGALLPNGTKIEISKIRGVVSNGMLCSERELGLSNESEGILILPGDTAPGLPLAKLLGRDDTILHLKVPANRGDCLSHLGIAREVASALAVPMGALPALNPVPKGPPVSLDFDRGDLPIAIGLDAADLAPQFWGAWIDGVEIRETPPPLVRRLEALGFRSINNVVDATNLALLETGQPMHAYDADRLAGGRIGVRQARAGESALLLDGQAIELKGGELVIADGATGDRIVGLAGVMGGGNSAVREGTRRLFLECAEFDSTLVRKAAFAYSRRTEAALRFEKGVDPFGQERAISRLAEWIVHLAGGRVVAAGRARTERMRARPKTRPIEARVGFFGEILGMELKPEEIEGAFAGPGFRFERGGDLIRVDPPSWRLDLATREDLAEEVALSVGYDKIPATLPALSSQPGTLDTSTGAADLALLDRAKDCLAAAGLREVANYGFQSQAWLSKLGFEESISVLNPISAEHERLVPSLLPGLVMNAIHNWNHHFGSQRPDIRLFEIRPTFSTGVEKIEATGRDPEAPDSTGVLESWKLAILLSGRRDGRSLKSEERVLELADLRGVIEDLFERMGTRGARIVAPATVPPGSSPASSPVPSPESRIDSRKPNLAKSSVPPCFLHPGLSAEVRIGNATAGWFGRAHPAFESRWEAKAPLWLAELAWPTIREASRPAHAGARFRPWAAFPSVERDFAFVVRLGDSSEQLVSTIVRAGRPLAKSARIFDVYRGPGIAEGMTSLAVRVIFSESDRSLEESEVEAVAARIVGACERELAAKLRA